MKSFENNVYTENNNLQDLLNYIIKNEFDINEKLPSERELAIELGISRNSLREILKILQTLGIIEIRHGSGIFLKKTEFYPQNNDLSIWLVIHKKEILDMIEIREALDLRAIDLIPENLYTEIRAQLKASINKIENSTKNNEKLLDHDLEFHNIIRRASGNEILTNICIALTGTIYDERKALFKNKKRIEQSLLEHKQIANAFGTHDINEVKIAYVAHLTSTRFSIENV